MVILKSEIFFIEDLNWEKLDSQWAVWLARPFEEDEIQKTASSLGSLEHFEEWSSWGIARFLSKRYHQTADQRDLYLLDSEDQCLDSGIIQTVYLPQISLLWWMLDCRAKSVQRGLWGKGRPLSLPYFLFLKRLKWTGWPNTSFGMEEVSISIVVWSIGGKPPFPCIMVASIWDFSTEK